MTSRPAATLAVVAWLVAALAGGAVHAEELPKKLATLAEKTAAKVKVKPSARDAVTRAMRKKIGKPPGGLLQIRNNWTHETLVLEARKDARVDQDTWNDFLRCHFTNRRATMEARLQGVLVAAALKFKRSRVDVVSGFRAPKFNLMLRKKGREVARDSQHTQGNAVDFRLPGIPTKALLAFVKRIRIGGVGFYPDSQFVHADSGPVRNWVGR